MDGRAHTRSRGGPHPAGDRRRHPAGRADRTGGRSREDAVFRPGRTAVGYRAPGAASCRGRTFERSRTNHRPQTGDVWLPHRRVPGGWLLPQRNKDLPAGSEPTPELPLHRLRRTGKPAAGGCPHFAGRAALHRRAHQPLPPKSIFSGRVRPAGSAGVHRAAGLAAHRRCRMERRCLCNVTRDDLAEPQSPQHHPVGRAHQRERGRRCLLYPHKSDRPSAGPQPRHLRCAISGKEPSAGGRLRLQRFFPQRRNARRKAQKGRNPGYGQGVAHLGVQRSHVPHQAL